MIANKLNKILNIFLLAVFFFAPLFSVYAQAGDFQVSGWIPYWQKTDGIKDARNHLDVFTEINPFGYSVHTDGTLNDLAGIKKSPWTTLFRKARSADVQIIPTVMWSDGTAMQAILNTPSARTRHVDEIVSMVEKGRYDGVDIDYEGKTAETKNGFSAFIKELKNELGSKILSCTIEPRTPAHDLYKKIPKDLAYANDYAVIGQYCDKVKIMAYDQQRADLTLNASKKGLPYAPVADIDWVRKVVNLAAQTIPKNKIMLGVPTYGRIWEVGVVPQQYKNYSQVKATNYQPALELAGDLGLTPTRNTAGELSFTYIPDTTTDPLSTIIRTVSSNFASSTAGSNITGIVALALSNASKLPTRFNLVWWSDAQAVEQKVALAKELGLSGIAIFKVDGDEDQNIWDLFSGNLALSR